ncbi:MAG: LAGLIDADG family homing endonuclease, partial [Candidatus Nanohaloarchaea archaeon]|nr:LAGLIDADG family homing endonuclease [Candidatus Nanohaloarchaea archaeon]
AKGTYAHPYWHAAKRRNCLPGDSGVRLADGSRIELAELYRRSDGGAVADETGTREKEIDLSVVSVDGREVTEQEAVKVYRTPAQEFKLKLETDSGRQMTVFPDHRVRTADGVVRARMLEEGDQLLTPQEVDVDVRDVESIELLERFGGRDDVMVRGVAGLSDAIEENGGLSAAAEIADVSAKQLDNYRRRRSVPAAVLENVMEEHQSEGWRLAARRDGVEIPARINVDASFMRLMGLYLAEGYMRKSEAEDDQFYQVCFAHGEDELRDMIVDAIEEVFGISPTVEEDAVTISSRLVFELFQDLGLGEDAHTKHVPDRYMSLPREKIAPMLAGYFAGDGSVEEGRLHVTADSVSRELLEDIDFLLKRFGVFTRMETMEREAGGILVEKYGQQHYAGRTFTSHRLHIRSVHAVQFCEEIGIALTRKQEVLERDTAKARSSREEAEGDMVLDPISSITVEEADERYMYDIEVKETHTFLTDGNLVSNNCDGDEDSIILLMDALLN